MYTWKRLAVVLSLVGGWYVSLPGGFGCEICSLISLLPSGVGLRAHGMSACWMLLVVGVVDDLSASHRPLQALDVARPSCTYVEAFPMTTPGIPPLSDTGVFRIWCGLLGLEDGAFLFVRGHQASSLHELLPSFRPVGVRSGPFPSRGSATDGFGMVLDIPLPSSDGKVVATATVMAPSSPLAPGDGFVGKCTGSAVSTSAFLGPSTVTLHGHSRDRPLPDEYSHVMQGFLVDTCHATVRPTPCLEDSHMVSGSSPGVYARGFGWIPGIFPDVQSTPEIPLTGQVGQSGQVDTATAGQVCLAAAVAVAAPPALTPMVCSTRW